MDISIVITIVSMLFSALVVIIGDSGLIAFLNKPNIHYLRTHDLKQDGKLIQGVFLINRGNKAAKEVIVKFSCDRSPVQADVDRVDLLKEPSRESNDKSVLFTLSDFPPKARVMFYVVRSEGSSLEVSGLFDGYRIHEDVNSCQRSFLERIAIFFGLFVLFWMLLGLFFP